MLPQDPSAATVSASTFFFAPDGGPVAYTPPPSYGEYYYPSRQLFKTVYAVSAKFYYEGSSSIFFAPSTSPIYVYQESTKHSFCSAGADCVSVGGAVFAGHGQMWSVVHYGNHYLGLSGSVKALAPPNLL